MTKIFYDGNCPICNKEINLYKKLNLSTNSVWYNIYSNKKALDIVNKSKDDCLKLLHVMDDNNKLFIGIDAFIVIWRETKYFKYLAFFIDFKIIRSILNFFYFFYAKKRYNKLYKKNV